MHLRATGIDQWTKAAQLVTGINQGLELLEKSFKAAAGATKMFVDTGAMFASYERQLTAITGSAEKAHQNVTELIEASRSMGDPIQEIMAATKQLELFGLYSTENLRIVSDAAKGMGKDINEVVNVIAMASEGNIRGIRRYGLNALNLAAEMGHKVKVDTIQDLEDIGQAVLKIFQKSYSGAGAAYDVGLGGMINQLRNNWVAFKKEVADAGPFQAARDIIGSILESVRSLFASGEEQRIGKVIGQALADLMYDTAFVLLKIAREVAQLTATVHEFLVRTGVVKGPEAPETGPALGARASLPERVFGYIVQGAILPTKAVIGSIPGSARYLRNGVYGEGGAAEAAPSAAVAAIDAAIAALQAKRAQVATSSGVVSPGRGGAGNVEGEGAAAPYKPGTPSVFGYGPRSFGAGVGTPGELAGLMGLGGEPLSKAADEIDKANAEKRKERIAELTGTLYGYWSSYYGSVGRMSDMMLSHDEKRWKKTRQIAWMGMRGMLADYIDMIVKEAAVGKLKAAADALLHGANFNVWSAAKAAAAAMAYGAIGAMSGSILRGSPDDMPSIDEGGDFDSAGSADNSRTTTRSAGVKAQSVTYNLYVIHNAPAIYGASSGIRELFESQFLPLLREYQGAYS
jgi:hypothetical protein